MSNYIEINEDAWASIKQRDPDETIYMINLLKFRDTVEEGIGVDAVSYTHLTLPTILLV